jgi:hypothetical protein
MSCEINILLNQLLWSVDSVPKYSGETFELEIDIRDSNKVGGSELLHLWTIDGILTRLSKVKSLALTSPVDVRRECTEDNELFECVHENDGKKPSKLRASL